MDEDKKELEQKRTRADRNRNPAAFTTDVAIAAGLVLNKDYKVGDPFPAPSILYTAYLINDPVGATIRVIDKLGFETKTGEARWTYINIPDFLWMSLSRDMKRRVIARMYKHEGGVELLPLFSSLH